MTDPRELEPDPPDYEPGQDDDWEMLLEWAPPPEATDADT